MTTRTRRPHYQERRAHADENWHRWFTYKDGFLFWKEHPHVPSKIGERVSYVSTTPDGNKYNRVRFFNRLLMVHRIIYAMAHGTLSDDVHIDHINGDSLDNRIENLRVATNRQNAYNSKIRSDNRSGYTGVAWDSSRKKWVASVKINGKTKYLGRYETAELAYARYCETVKPVHGEFFRGIA